MTFNGSDVPKGIPDNGTVTSTLTVPQGACSKITDVNVSVNITHPLVSDLSVSIAHNGTGKSAVLFKDSCTSDNDLIAIFDDEAAAPIQCPPHGVYKPEELLSIFAGIDASGTWTLTVTDQSTLDVGTLNGGKAVLLKGGFDSAYLVNISGYTLLNGVLTLGTGSLTVENLIIK